jgi:hypothetical protein
MPTSIKHEAAITVEGAGEMLDNFTRARNAALALLQMSADRAIATLEAQPAHCNIAIAADFRSLELDDGHTISCTIRGWKLKWGICIIPGLHGVVTSPDAKGMGQYIPFENFLPKSTAHGIAYVDLVAAIAYLSADAAQAEGGDGQDND